MQRMDAKLKSLQLDGLVDIDDQAAKCGFPLCISSEAPDVHVAGMCMHGPKRGFKVVPVESTPCL